MLQPYLKDIAGSAGREVAAMLLSGGSIASVKLGLSMFTGRGARQYLVER
jgi:hypothetical protein